MPRHATSVPYVDQISLEKSGGRSQIHETKKTMIGGKENEIRKKIQ
jgi:hypothetical protein